MAPTWLVLVLSPSALALQVGLAGASLRAATSARPRAAGTFRMDGSSTDDTLEEGVGIEAAKKRAAKQMLNGVTAGGWDSDQYLESTKASPPPPPDTKEALRQAEAYVAMLRDKSMPPRPDVEAMIAEMKAGTEWEKVEGVGDGNKADEFFTSLRRGGSEVDQEESAERMRLYKERERKAKERLLAGPSKGVDTPLPPTANAPGFPATAPMPPPAPVVSTRGVVSGGSYADLLGASPRSNPGTAPEMPLAAAKPAAKPAAPPEAPPAAPPAATISGGVVSSSSYAALSVKAAGPPPPPLPKAAPVPAAVAAPAATPPPAAAAASGPRRVAPTAGLPPIPDKDPAELRRQYEQYLQACVAQTRPVAKEVTDLIARVCEKHPPGPSEDEVVRNIARSERALGVQPLFPHIPVGVAPAVPPAGPPMPLPVRPVAATPAPAPVPLPVPQASPTAAGAASGGATPEPIGRALELLRRGNAVGLGALGLAEREELLDALIGSMAVVQRDIRTGGAAAGCPAMGSDTAAAVPPPARAVPPTAAPRGSPLPSLASAPKASDLLGTRAPAPVPAPATPQPPTRGVVSGSSYSAVVSGASAGAAPAPAAAGLDLVGKTISPASTYYVEGMEQMGTEEYMAALERKLQAQKLERKTKLGNAMGVKASNNYMEWLEKKNNPSSDQS